MEIMQGMEFVSQDKEIKFYFKFDYKLLQFFFSPRVIWSDFIFCEIILDSLKKMYCRCDSRSREIGEKVIAVIVVNRLVDSG